MTDIVGRGYKSEWWGKRTRKKFLMWASYFVVGVYLLVLATFAVLSLSIPQTAADPAHMAFLQNFVIYFSSPVILFAILLVLWSRETQ